MGTIITSQNKAIAAEAINRHPDLSPSARRVALELLNRVDKNTGLAWPSEHRMAEALGLNVRTIRRGKAELHALGLLTWIRRGTSRQGRTPLYALAWGALLNIAAAIKTRTKAACDKAKASAGGSTKPLAFEKQSTSIELVTTAKQSPAKPALVVERTFSSAYLTQYIKKASEKGFWKAPGTPQGQTLSDQQLDARASARFYTALQQLGGGIMAQFIARPDADVLQAKAIRAERYQQGAGITVLRDLLVRGETA